MFFDNLSVHAKVIVDNLEAFSKAFPKLSEAAEAVHQGFNTLLYEFVQLDTSNIPMSTAIIMGFGSHGSWINAYNLAASGYSDSSWADMRRAIEFACYAAKVYKSEKRALSWMNQRTDRNSQKQFSLNCSIPSCYKSEDYSFLRGLLVAYDTANYYGSHGNIETLANRYFGTKDDSMIFTYLSDKKAIPNDAGLKILLGYRLLQAFNIILTSSIVNKEKLDSVMNFVTNAVKACRLSLAKIDYKGFIPSHVFKSICTDNQDEIYKMFNEMITRESERTKKSNAGTSS